MEAGARVVAAQRPAAHRAPCIEHKIRKLATTITTTSVLVGRPPWDMVFQPGALWPLRAGRKQDPQHKCSGKQSEIQNIVVYLKFGSVFSNYRCGFNIGVGAYIVVYLKSGAGERDNTRQMKKGNR